MEAISDKTQFRGHIVELNAFRAFGITMVVLAHMWPHESFRAWRLLQLCWTLMDGFFVLSGFLIGGILLDSRSRPDYYRSFYTRRALRILPVYYMVITVVTCYAMLFGTGAYQEMLRTWGPPWWFFIYLGNIPTALKGAWPLAAGGAYVPLWSLQVEEQFYLLFPILVRRLRLETLERTLLGMACVSTILRIAIYYWDPYNTPVQYVFLPCRMEGLAFGAWIALRFRQKPWVIPKQRLTVITVLWLAALAVYGAWGGYYHTTPLNRTLGMLISPIAFAHVVLWLIVFRGSRITACLRLRLVQHLGEISYGGYLLHWPIGATLAAASTAVGIHTLNHGFPRLATIFVLTIVCASLSWRYFESPLLRLKDRRRVAHPSRTGKDAAPLRLERAQ